MSCAPEFLFVADHVARNPVVRAVANQRLAAAVRTFQVRLYLLHEGEQVQADGTAAAKAIYVAWLVLDARGERDSPRARVLHGAISAIEQLSKRAWRWRCIDAAALDAGISHASAVAAEATVAEMRAGWQELDEIDRRIGTEFAPT